MAKLTSMQQRFVLHWGEMGTRWGISRTVAQVHALLYISEKPLNAEEISESLSVARSNVSTSLKELQNWGIVRKIPVLGDKRDHFESLHDVWDMFRIILEERKKREVDPTLALIEQVMAEAEGKGESDSLTVERLKNLRDFFRTTTQWYDAMQKVPSPALLEILKAGSSVTNFMANGETRQKGKSSGTRRQPHKTNP